MAKTLKKRFYNFMKNYYEDRMINDLIDYHRFTMDYQNAVFEARAMNRYLKHSDKHVMYCCKLAAI